MSWPRSTKPGCRNIRSVGIETASDRTSRWFTRRSSRRREEFMATTAAVLNESAPASDYARLEERILARDQKGASDVLYRLMKQGRPLTELTRETVRMHAPYTHVPYHQRLDDGIVKFVNNDHCLLSERVGLPLASMIRPELRYLPMAQTVWYMPTGLDPWNQLIGKAPGHYTRLYDIKVNTTPPMPERHWPDQEPLNVEGTLRERLNHWLTLVHDRPQGLSRARHHRARRGHRLGPGPPRALRRRARHRGRPALVFQLRDGLQRHPERARRPRPGAAPPGHAADAGRGSDAGRGHPAPARILCHRRAGGVARVRTERAPHPRHHPDRRGAGHSRDGRAQQLLDGAARLRVRQHGRLVLRHLRAPAPAEAPVRGRALHQPRLRAPDQHAGQRPPHGRAAGGLGRLVVAPAPREAGAGVARSAGRGVGGPDRRVLEGWLRSRAARADVGDRRVPDRERPAQP